MIRRRLKNSDDQMASGAPCPLSDEILALLPCGFIELDEEGTVLRVKTGGKDTGGPEMEWLVGLLLFSDLMRPPDSGRVGHLYQAMVRQNASNRCLTAVRFALNGQERCVEIAMSYWASAGRGYVLLREAAPRGGPPATG